MPGIAFPAGPVFGPDSVVIDAADTGSSIDVHIYPDAHNVELKAAGQPTQYYFQPARISLARRQNSPDVDFSMTALVKHAPGGPHLEYIGGSCTFTTTLALPDAAAARIIDKLISHDHPDPAARIAKLFNYRRGDPAPGLRMVPITRSAVSCVIEHPRTGTDPIFMSAQHSPDGSIEAQGRNSFLVSCTPAAAEDIATNLRDGTAPPFMIRNVLTEQFDTGPTTLVAQLEVDVDKLYEAFSAVVPPGTPLLGKAAADAIHQAAASVAAIHVDFTEAGARVDSPVAAFLKHTDILEEAIFAMVKEQLFDTGPGENLDHGEPEPTWWDEVFGNSTVTLKTDHARTGVVLRKTVTLHGAVLVEQAVEGYLDELAAAAKAELDTYLTVVDIGAF